MQLFRKHVQARPFKIPGRLVPFVHMTVSNTTQPLFHHTSNTQPSILHCPTNHATKHLHPLHIKTTNNKSPPSPLITKLKLRSQPRVSINTRVNITMRESKHDSALKPRLEPVYEASCPRSLSLYCSLVPRFSFATISLVKRMRKKED